MYVHVYMLHYHTHLHKHGVYCAKRYMKPIQYIHGNTPYQMLSDNQHRPDYVLFPQYRLPVHRQRNMIRLSQTYNYCISLIRHAILK